MMRSCIAIATVVLLCSFQTPQAARISFIDPFPSTQPSILSIPSVVSTQPSILSIPSIVSTQPAWVPPTIAQMEFENRILKLEIENNIQSLEIDILKIIINELMSEGDLSQTDKRKCFSPQNGHLMSRI